MTQMMRSTSSLTQAARGQSVEEPEEQYGVAAEEAEQEDNESSDSSLTEEQPIGVIDVVRRFAEQDRREPPVDKQAYQREAEEEEEFSEHDEDEDWDDQESDEDEEYEEREEPDSEEDEEGQDDKSENEDEETAVTDTLTNEVVEEINRIAINTLEKGSLEIGAYVLKRIFNNDLEEALSKAPNKKDSFNSICKHHRLRVDARRLSDWVQAAALRKELEDKAVDTNLRSVK